MKIIVGMEESQAITLAFRDAGHEAYSCDLKQCSGGRPDIHITGDVRDVMYDKKWDFGIFHPMCTRLANSGSLRLYINGSKKNGPDLKKWEEMRAAAEFFKLFLDLPYPSVVENPIQHKHAKEIIGKKYSQIIQPWQYGHPESKATCLWLPDGLPLLQPTNILKKPEKGHWDNQTASGQNKLPPGGKRAELRSKTYHGVAAAMAEQWGSFDFSKLK